MKKLTAMRYFKNRKFAKENKDRLLRTGLDKCRILGWDWATGNIVVRIFDEWSNTTYLAHKNHTDIS